MEMSHLTLRLIEQFQEFATRPEGIRARTILLQRLQEADEIELDFSGVSVTPSFADECVGRLAAQLGKDEFNRRVRFTNVPAEIDSLLKLVIMRQLSSRTPLAKATG
jgi:hypothetical protein